MIFLLYLFLPQSPLLSMLMIFFFLTLFYLPPISYRLNAVLISCPLGLSPDTINISKTKYMIISRKPSSFLSLFPSLFLVNSPLECVSHSTVLLFETLILTDIKKLEGVQFFALKLCSKHWDYDYQSLLHSFYLPSLFYCRRSFKLIHLYKFIYKLLYIPNHFIKFQSRTSYSLRSYHPLNLKVPYSHSTATLHSSCRNQMCQLH